MVVAPWRSWEKFAIAHGGGSLAVAVDAREFAGARKIGIAVRRMSLNYMLQQGGSADLLGLKQVSVDNLHGEVALINWRRGRQSGETSFAGLSQKAGYGKA